MAENTTETERETLLISFLNSPHPTLKAFLPFYPEHKPELPYKKNQKN